MKRRIVIAHSSAAWLSRALGLLLLLIAVDVRAGNYCNNAVPPCDPSAPSSACFRPTDPPPKCEPKICDKCTKSPCYVGTGVYSAEQSDLEISTNGFPIAVTRQYQSSRAIDGESGYGWVSSLSARLYYAVYLKAAPDSFRGDDMEADIRLPNGTLYRFAENADGTFSPPQGRFDSLVRNADGTWDLQLQRTRSHLHFSPTGDLLRQVDDFGNAVEWTYAKDRVTRIADTSGSGRFIDITWGADGRVSDVTDLTGRNVHYTYDTNGRLTAARNPASQSIHYSYAAGKYGPLLSGISDHWGRNITTITYDAQDRTKSYTEKGETYTYTYAYGGVATTTAKSDSSGNVWLFPFTGGGLVTDSVPPGGGAGGHTDYDSNGLVQIYTDAVGVKTRYTYDARGNIQTRTLDHQGSAAVEWRYVYDTNFRDNVTSVTPYVPGTNDVHRHWQAKKFDYYPPGSIAPGALHHIYEVDDDGVTSRIIRTYTYDAHGRPVTETFANGAIRSLTYDSAGNVEREETPANNASGIRPVTTATHDLLGRVLTTTDPEGNVTTYTWDVLNRLVSRTDPAPSASSPLNFTTTTYYDEFDAGSQLLGERIVDPNGAIALVARDAYGQIVSQTDAGGYSIRFLWEKGLLKSRLDANNYATSYSYDARRRLDVITYPDSSFEQYAYRADDTIASFRDRSGSTIVYSYDALKRMRTASYPGGATVTWTYDGQKLTTVEDSRVNSAGTLTQVWNATFRVQTETQGSRGTLAWTYDLEGRRISETVDGGTTTTYGYYPDGSLSAIEWSPISGSFVHEYDLAGRLTRIQFPNTQTRTWAHDGQGRVLSVANVHPTAGNLATFEYGYDVNAFTGQPTRLGLLTRTTTSFPALSMAGAVTKFDYDVRRMLIRADYAAGSPYNGQTSAWTFDAAANRTSATVNGITATYSYGRYGTNQLNWSTLQSDGGSSYTYDTAGNTITRSGARGNFVFGWDADNRLSSVSGDETESYRYDTIQRRVTKTTPAGTTSSLYSDFQVVKESGASNAQYLFTAGLDHPLAMIRDGSVYYYAVDGLGSVVAVNDASGAIVDSYAYDAWGVTVARNETVANPFGFTGRPLAAAGLADHRFRAYEPATGSFRSFDPLISMVGRALATKATAAIPELPAYGYANARPGMSTDPFGLDACEKCRKDYAIESEKCRKTLGAGIAGCTATYAICLLISRSPAGCVAVFAVCAGVQYLNYSVCTDAAVRKFDLCMEYCSSCPRPSGPPPACGRSDGRPCTYSS